MDLFDFPDIPLTLSKQSSFEYMNMSAMQPLSLSRADSNCSEVLDQFLLGKRDANEDKNEIERAIFKDMMSSRRVKS